VECKKRPKIIGITGGIASGKTTVAAMLVRLGAKLISADEVAREVLQEKQVQERIAETWGEEMLTPTGEVNRKRLAQRVFDKREELARLNAIVHPLIIRKIKQEIERLSAQERGRPVVLDAALIQEVGLAKDCDVVVFVDADRNRRLERAKWHRGWDSEELARRERFQMPIAAKKRHADYIVDNSGSEEETRADVISFWHKFARPK